MTVPDIIKIKILYVDNNIENYTLSIEGTEYDNYEIINSCLFLSKYEGKKKCIPLTQIKCIEIK